MASRPASAAATTEAQPFTPQAHGTSAGAAARSRARASGNGRPMAKASGATRATARAARGTRGEFQAPREQPRPGQGVQDRQRGDQRRYQLQAAEPWSARAGPRALQPAPPRRCRSRRRPGRRRGSRRTRARDGRAAGPGAAAPRSRPGGSPARSAGSRRRWRAAGGGRPGPPAAAPAAGSGPAADRTATPSVASCNGQPQSSRPALPCRAAAQSAGSARQRKKSRK